MGEVQLVDTETGELTLFDAAKFTQNALALEDNLSFENWQKLGEQLRLMEGSVMWWIGDWLNYGETKYGETYQQALDATDKSYQQLANAKLVSSKYEISRRRENLSFSHHQDALGASDPDAVLAWAEENKASVKELRHRVRDDKRGIASQVLPPIGEYSVIYADPDGS